MNKVYKVIWSKVKGCYVVVSELTKKNGKSKYEHICREGVCELSLKAILCVLAITGSALFWPMEVSAGTQYGDDQVAALINLKHKPCTTCSNELRLVDQNTVVHL